jgi:hypothetical protein
MKIDRSFHHETTCGRSDDLSRRYAVGPFLGKTTLPRRFPGGSEKSPAEARNGTACAPGFVHDAVAENRLFILGDESVHSLGENAAIGGRFVARREDENDDPGRDDSLTELRHEHDCSHH